MRIYTRTGDDGTTGLFGGGRLSKADPLIDCYGNVDELNAAIGWAAVVAHGVVLDQLRQVQSDLFVIGTHLTTPQSSTQRSSLPPLDQAMVSRLETQIDEMDAALPPLRNFILPGGGELAARLHVARTICRAAERALVDLSTARPIPPVVLHYLNRLSDWLFVQARRANQAEQVADIPWIARA